MSAVDFGAQHGKKRPAPGDDLEGDQPLTKRFNRLQLGHHQHAPLSQPAQEHASPKVPIEDHMYLDDTKDKVYIHDLDAELADLEEEQQPQIEFLPEIEKKLAAFPSLLETRVLSPAQGQLVLYRPISFSEELKDERRKAILEERRKARVNGEQKSSTEDGGQSNGIDLDDTLFHEPPDTPDDDPDAMDMDMDI